MLEYYDKMINLKHSQSKNNKYYISIQSYLYISSIMIFKKCLAVMTLSVFFIQSTYAAWVASFVVEVNPSTAGVNQAVDLKVKAVDSNGSVVKDYANNIFIEVPAIKDLQDVGLPSDGIYTFSAQDQWEKTFSKGLTIKAPGTYTVQVSDIENEAIKWQAQIIIQAWSTQNTTQNVMTISSPLPNSTETNSTVSVVGNAWVKNAKVQVLLNGVKVKEEQSNQNGDFTTFLTDLKPGQYTLKTLVKDVSDQTVAASADIQFTYQAASLGDIQAFDVLPSKTLKQGQKATFSVRVGVDTTSVELLLRDWANKEIKLQLDKTQDGVFQKQLLMDTAETYTVDVVYSMGTETKTQAGAATISVLEWKGIREVTYLVDPIDKTKLSLWWKPIGDVEYVLVQYGIDKDKLGEGIVLTGSTGYIAGLDLAKQAYYVRLFPANEKWEIAGEPSDLILVEQVQWSAPICRVEWITVSTTKIGDQYFLTRKAAENAERYIVYRSDRPARSIAEMQKVWETSDLKFPYPFDPQAKSEWYAYYAVVAICQDGSSLQVWDTKKVKVWPATNAILLFLVSAMVFGIYRMRKISE